MNERIVLIGGAGAMARPAIDILAQRPDVAEIVLADRDLAAAQQVAAEVTAATTRRAEGDAVGARALELDACDVSAVRAALGGARVVLNTAGPFFRLGVPVLQAAIDTGTHYLDICDDWEPTLDMLALHDRARAAGVVAIIGAGASPGVSNLLAALAAEQLDTVTELYTGWPVDGDDGEEVTGGPPSAAAVHWLHQLSGEIRVFDNGAPRAGRPLEPIMLDYPGLGTGTAYTVGHPEPLTLPRSHLTIDRAACVMVARPWTVAYLMVLRDDVDAGVLTVPQAAAALGAPSLRRVVRAGRRAPRLRGPGRLPPFFALARGARADARTTVGARLLGAPRGMAALTGCPLAIAAGQVLDGAAARPGVHPPDAVLDLVAFFDALAPHCDPPLRGFGELVAVDR